MQSIHWRIDDAYARALARTSFFVSLGNRCRHRWFACVCAISRPNLERLHRPIGSGGESVARSAVLHNATRTRVGLRDLSRREAGCKRTARGHGQNDRAACSCVQFRSFHGPSEDGKVVSPQLRGCRRARVHSVGEGRHSELADHARAMRQSSAIGNDYDYFARSNDVDIRRASVAARALAAFALTAVMGAAFGEDGPQVKSPTPSPAYRQECAACHIAYPPGMLPADSWRHILGNLDRHFGTNASLDPASVKQIAGWLTTHAADAGRAASAPPEDRITRSRWFIATHDEVPASTWRLPAVKSASNCAACHTRADQGNFDERYVRIPR